MANFEISELSSVMLVNAFAYYHANHFYKLNFDEWLVTEWTAERNNNGELIRLKREKKTRYSWDIDYITDRNLNESFINLLKQSIN